MKTYRQTYEKYLLNRVQKIVAQGEIYIMNNYTPFEEEGYIGVTVSVRRSVGSHIGVTVLVGRKPYFVRPISYKPQGGIQ